MNENKSCSRCKETEEMQHEFGFLCKVDFNWELGAALGGNTVYPSIEDLKENHKCWEECGIVKVKVSLEEIVCEDRRTRESNDKKEE